MEEINQGHVHLEPLSVSNIEDAKYQHDSSHLEENNKFFSNVVWNEILQKLTIPDDIENCSNSSPFFLKFLGRIRETSVLLPKVFVLLLDYFIKNNIDEDDGGNDDNTNENTEDFNESDNDSNESDTLDCTSQTNSIKLILKCRQICKSWKYVIDRCCQNRDTGHFRLQFEMKKYPLYQFSAGYCYTFEPKDRFKEFLQHFDTNHYYFQLQKPIQNPFLGRQVKFLRINMRSQFHIYDARDKDYINEIGKILKKYGTELWYASFSFEVKVDGNVLQFYLQLNKFLHMMPNLKVLRLSYDENWDIYKSDVIERETLRQTISHNQLPPLKMLQFIHTENVPTVVLNELVHKSNALIQLQVHQRHFYWDKDIFTQNLSHLTALNIEFGTVADFEKFENCRIPINLKTFHFLYKKSNLFFPWSRLFRVLENKLGESCEELVLELPVPKNNEQVKQVLIDSRFSILNLPNLKRITIYNDVAHCLDFLLPCKMLEILFIRYIKDRDRNVVRMHIGNNELQFSEFEKNQTLQFLGFEDKLDESNVWIFFPKLRVILIQREMVKCITYSRNRKIIGNISKNVLY